MSDQFEYLLNLPTNVKLQLIDDLWESVKDDDIPPNLSDETLKEILRRDAEMDADPNRGISEEELWKRVYANRL